MVNYATLETSQSLYAELIALKQGKKLRSETQHRRKNGDIYHVSVKAHKISDLDGKIVAFFQDITERKKIEDLHSFLAQSSYSNSEQPFFHRLAEYLAHYLKMDFICIDRLDSDQLTAHTVAVWSNGHFEDNISYKLQDTPCGQLVTQEICCYPECVCQHFPKDLVLQELKAESYIGVTLFNNKGLPIGLIAVIGRGPIEDRRLAEFALQQVGIRAAGEMQRLIMEEELRTSEEKYRLAMDATSDGLWDWDVLTHTVDYSPGWYRMLGLDEVPPEYEVWESRIHPDDKKEVLESLILHLNQGSEFWVKEHRLRTLDNEWKWVLGRGKVVEFDPAGAPVRMIGTMTDIHDRKTAEHDVIIRNNELESLYDFSKLVLENKSFEIVIDDLVQKVSQITAFPIVAIELYDEPNQIMEFIASVGVLANKPESNLKVPVSATISGVVAQTGEPIWETRALDRTEYRYELLRKLSVQKFFCLPMKIDEKILGTLTLASPESFISENPPSTLLSSLANYIALFVEKKRYEEEKNKLQMQLIQSQKMEAIGTLAGGIAHDFNNILGAILGYTELARAAVPSNSSIAEDLNHAIRAVHRATALVRQILDFSRQSTTNPHPLYPNDIIKEAIQLLRQTIPSTIDFVQNYTSTKRQVFADPSQLHQIVMNLGTNAYHAMKETGGTLTFETKECFLSDDDLLVQSNGLLPGIYLRISCADTGTGIPSAIMPKIFDPYFTTKETGKGTGMGLSIVHGIVNRLGGFITCGSEVGKGTKFQLFFPVVDGESSKETSLELKDITGHEHILFIDDEQTLADMGKTMLERVGYRVTAMTSSTDALVLFENEPYKFDLVITDQTMPNLTGVNLAKKMIKIRPEIPIILCTGYSGLPGDKKFEEYGIKMFAMKPLSKDILGSMIRKVLQK